MRPIGIQLYTLRKPFAADPLGTLSRIRETGYDSVEFAAPLDMDFASMAERMQAVGLDCPSLHVGLADITGQPGHVLDVARTLGARFIVLPYVDPNDADWKGVVVQAQAFARQARDEGFRFCYHHHHFEFDTARGFRPFDVLVGGSGPDLLFFELDVFWLKTAGQDPLDMIGRLAGRVKLLHLKDFAADTAMTDVGSGTLDFPAILAAGDAAGVEHMFVEHDFPPRPYWPSVEASLAHLRTLD